MKAVSDLSKNVEHSERVLVTPRLEWMGDRLLVFPQVELRDLFRNQDATEFCIVTIPTQLAIAESKRLLAALNSQGVAVRNVVVNQVCGAIGFCCAPVVTIQCASPYPGRIDDLDLPLPFLVVQVVSPDASAEYVSRLHKGQAACIQRLERLAEGRGEEGKLDISPVPFFDMEVAGVYPLRYETKRGGLSFPFQD